MMTILWVLLAVIFSGLAYVRLAPSDPTIWHIAPQVSENKDFKAGVKRLIASGPDGLARFDAIVMATPRTSVLTGTVESGMVTYITRSRIFGFPDYTTVQQDNSSMKIYARLRFGRSDTGVNRARVEAWTRELRGALQP